MAHSFSFSDGEAVSSGGAYTPAIDTYATEAEVAAIWSQYGVDVRIDDDQDGNRTDSGETGTMNRFLEKATADVNNSLLLRYTVAVCAVSTWVKWCTAYFAALDIGRRRGMPIPPELEKEAQRYRDALNAIANNERPLIGDDGPAASRFNATPIVSNMAVDRRFQRSKIRRIDATSSQATPASPRKQNTTLDNFYWT